MNMRASNNVPIERPARGYQPPGFMYYGRYGGWGDQNLEDQLQRKAFFIEQLFEGLQLISEKDLLDIISS